MTGENGLEVVGGLEEQPKALSLAREASLRWVCCVRATWLSSWGCEKWLGVRESNVPKAKATGISYDVMVRRPLEKCCRKLGANKDVCLATTIAKRKGGYKGCSECTEHRCLGSL